MVFSQGGHLMLNKCKPPKGSFKRAKKGYEEIHIPVPKQNPTDDAGLVPISSLLEWVEQTLPGAKKLNRVQGK
jgi:pre-mRNA-splicing helicase BRR2